MSKHKCVGLALTLIGLGGTRNHTRCMMKTAGKPTRTPCFSLSNGRWLCMSRLHLNQCDGCQIMAQCTHTMNLSPGVLCMRPQFGWFGHFSAKAFLPAAMELVGLTLCGAAFMEKRMLAQAIAQVAACSWCDWNTMHYGYDKKAAASHSPS